MSSNNNNNNRRSKNSSSSRSSRAEVEKIRRSEMRNLYGELHSLVPHQGSSSGVPLPDQIDEATNYIRKMQEDLARLEERRDNLRGGNGDGYNNPHNGAVQIQVNENGGALEVTMITGLEFQFVFSEVIRVLQEEDADVLNANYSVVENTVYHTIHAQIGENASSYAAARISERLRQFAM